MLSAVTIRTEFRENLIQVSKHLIKHTLFINFGENGKYTNRTILFDIKFVFLFMNGLMSVFLDSEGKIELYSELLKL